LGRRVSGWVVLGVVAAFVELGLLSVLVDGLHWELPVATAVAAEALILAKFFIADRWVFGYPKPNWERLVKYHAACAGAFVVYWLVINGLNTGLQVPYGVGFAAGTVASFLWSLVTNFLWVWVKR
jgi:putative flippase GtrA